MIDSLGLGGAEQLVVTLATASASADLELQVASISSTADQRREMVAPLRAVGIEPQFLAIPRLLSVGAVPLLARTIRASGCDVVHAHLEYAATLATPAARIAGRPAVCTFHHVPQDGLPWRDRVREWLAVAVASRSAASIFVSCASLDEFARRYRLARRNAVVTPNGIDLQAFSPEPASFPEELGVPEGARAVLLPAALRPGKGHQTLLHAWPAVRARVPSATLVLAGSGHLQAQLEALAASLGVADSVIFAGFRTDVARLMRASELIVLPTEAEALPTALVEAAACGRAVVASNVGGVPEVVRDGTTGELVGAGDTAELADGVVALLTDDARRRGMGAAARRHAEAHFSAEAWAAALRETYERAMTADRTRRRAWRGRIPNPVTPRSG